MNKIISSVVGVVAVAGLVLGFVSYNKPSQIINQAPNVSAVTGPDTYYEYVANNNLQKFGRTIALTQGTSTVCAIKSPAATSTLSMGGVSFVVSSSTATTIWIARATTAFATTTSLATSTISANAQGFTNAFATSSVGVDTALAAQALVFPPSTFFVVGVSGGALGTAGNNANDNTNPNFGYKPVGSCSAEFTRI